MKRLPRVNGVYAIHYPEGVYVGCSRDCWRRATLHAAVRDGLPCGIVRETPNASRLERIRAEREVALAFERRGFTLLSHYLTYSHPQQYGRAA